MQCTPVGNLPGLVVISVILCMVVVQYSHELPLLWYQPDENWQQEQYQGVTTLAGNDFSVDGWLHQSEPDH